MYPKNKKVTYNDVDYIYEYSYLDFDDSSNEYFSDNYDEDESEYNYSDYDDQYFDQNYLNTLIKNNFLKLY